MSTQQQIQKFTMNDDTKKGMCHVEKEVLATSFGIKLQKYGEIVLSSDGDEFILCCTLCIEIFFEYTHFLKHARIQHNVQVDDSTMQEKSSADFEWEQTQELEAEQEQLEEVEEELFTIQNAKEMIVATEIAVDHSEEVICHTTDICYEETILEQAAADSEVTLVTKDNYNVEYLLTDCFNFDGDILPTDENISSGFQHEASRKPNHKNLQYNKKEPATNYSINSLIRKKRLLWYFIELYKEHPCLWRADHEHVANRDERLAAIEEIATTMHRRFRYQITTSKVIKTIKNIRASYLREWHRKAKNAQYIPKLWYYRKLSFIEDAISYDAQYCYINDDEVLQRIITPLNPKCDNCQREFKTKQGWRQHLRTHSDCKPYKCDQCEKCFRSLANLQAHLTAHAPLEERRYSCEFCGLKIALQHNYLVHLRRHTKEFKHHCLVCGKGVANSAELKIHMMEHTGERPYRCNICNMTFKLPDTLLQHQKRHIKEGGT